jgi:hypothetical protein
VKNPRNDEVEKLAKQTVIASDSEAISTKELTK